MAEELDRLQEFVKRTSERQRSARQANTQGAVQRSLPDPSNTANNVIEGHKATMRNMTNAVSFGATGIIGDAVDAAGRSMRDLVTGEDSSPGVSDFEFERMRTKALNERYSTESMLGDVAGTALPLVGLRKGAGTVTGKALKELDEAMFGSAPSASRGGQVLNTGVRGGAAAGSTAYGSGANTDELGFATTLGGALAPAATVAAAVAKNVKGKVLDTGLFGFPDPKSMPESMRAGTKENMATRHADQNVADALFDDLGSNHRGIIHNRTSRDVDAEEVTPERVRQQLLDVAQSAPDMLVGEALEGTAGANMIPYALQQMRVPGVQLPGRGVDVINARSDRETDIAAGVTARVLNEVSPNTTATDALAQLASRKEATNAAFDAMKSSPEGQRTASIVPVLRALNSHDMNKIPSREQKYFMDLRDRLTGNRTAFAPRAPGMQLDTTGLLEERQLISRELRRLYSADGTADAADLTTLDKLHQIKKAYDDILSAKHPKEFEKLTADYGAALREENYIGIGNDAVMKPGFSYDRLEHLLSKATQAEKDALKTGATQAFINKMASRGEASSLRNLSRNEDADIVRKLKLLFGDKAFDRMTAHAEKAAIELKTTRGFQQAMDAPEPPTANSPNKIIDMLSVLDAFGGTSTRATAARRLSNVPNTMEGQRLVELMLSPVAEGIPLMERYASLANKPRRALSPAIAGATARGVGSQVP